MQIQKVTAAYFSCTNTTKQVVTVLAKQIAESLSIDFDIFDFTLPDSRKQEHSFAAQSLIVFGTPVYAGRVPNVLLKYLSTLHGNGALAVPIVLFGNRNFDNALIELRDILEKDGLHTLAAAAFVGEHSFSRILGAGRPDSDDIKIVVSFADKITAKIKSLETIPYPIEVIGDPYPYKGYFQPHDHQGKPLNTLKVKSLVNENCDNCGICAKVCPLGSINPENIKEYTGICIKCGACIKKCPNHARYYNNPDYLTHLHELEVDYARRAEPSLFI